MRMEPDDRPVQDGVAEPVAGGGDEPIAAIAAAVAGLDDLDELPVADHVERFDAVHVALNVALSTIDRE